MVNPYSRSEDQSVDPQPFLASIPRRLVGGVLLLAAIVWLVAGIFGMYVSFTAWSPQYDSGKQLALELILFTSMLCASWILASAGIQLQHMRITRVLRRSAVGLLIPVATWFAVIKPVAWLVPYF